MKEFQPHTSHQMTEWENTVVTLIATPRFGLIRQCKLCGAEEAKTVCGHQWHNELELPCELEQGFYADMGALAPKRIP